MAENPQDLNAVEALLSERDALHGWLTRLDSTNAKVPQGVLSRVREDYRHRLDGVTERLTAHADAIAGKLQADISEHKSLIREATVAREALAEADLRHAVGEYDDARHESERVRHVADLEAYEVSIAAVADRVGRLEEVFAVVNRVPVAPVQPQSSAPGTPAPQAPVAPAWREAEAPVNIDDLAPSQPDDDADEGLLAIFEQESDSSSDEPTASDDVVMGGDQPRAGDFAPLTFKPAGGPDGITPPPVSAPEPPSMPRFSRAASEPAASRPAPSIDPVVSRPAATTPVTASDSTEPVAARTLRCGECGAMNRPMEWYCEKCGAELDAV